MPQVKTAYTPGPWKIGKRDTVVGKDNFEICDPDQGPHLHEKFNANKGHWGSTPGAYIDRPEEEIQANTRLIAAAPEMFEAIKQHLENCGPREWSPEWKGSSCPGGDGLHEKFRKIIRKVEEEA